MDIEKMRRVKEDGRSLAAMAAIAGAAACLLCGYEFIRSPSSSLYIRFYTADRIPIVMALVPVGVILSIYGYGVLLSRFGPRRALLITSFLSGALMVGCYFGIGAGWAPAAGVLYVLREAYIVLVLEQYWSLINSTLSREQARKMNGPITGIGSLGAIVGAGLVHHFAQRLGTETFILLSAASLLPAALCSWAAYTLAGEPQAPPEEAGGKQGHLALSLFRRSPMLALLALLIALTQVVSTVLDLRFNGLVEAAFPETDARTAYFAWFYQMLNVAAGTLQFIAAPLILHLVPVRRVHAAIPLVHLGTGLALLLHPSLATGAVALMTFKALDYSLFRASKEILYIPLSFDVRYRAKEVIDAFVYRFSKGGLGLAIALSRGVLGSLPGATYAGVSMAAAALWLPVVLTLTRQKRDA